jgi:muramoyltetrapeptide carboxypeptidase
MTAARPPRVERGQTVGIVAPAGPIKPERLRAGLARLGDAFKLRIAPSVTAPHPPDVPSYLAAADDVRAAELNAMIADPDVRAIILARGGYGLMRILPRLDASALRRDPKPIVGFSDATALLSWAYAAGVRGIHGPMIGQLADLSDSDTAQLVTLLTTPTAPGLRPWSLTAHGKGSYRGPLLAGNLTMIATLVGTPWPMPLTSSIVVLEEVGERPYEIDRYLTQLLLSGELAKLTAAIIGDLTRCFDPAPPTGTPDPPDAALSTILERFHTAGTPTAVGAPIGHGTRNEPIPFGALSILDLDASTFEITESAVS